MPAVATPGPSAPGSTELVVMLNLRFKPDSAEEVLKQMLPVIDATRNEAGNNEYTFYKATDRPDEYVFVERWRDQAAFDEHLEQPFMKAVFELFDKYLVFPMSEIAEHRTFLDDVRPAPAAHR